MLKIKDFKRNGKLRDASLLFIAFCAGLVISGAAVYFNDRLQSPHSEALRESDIPSSTGYTFTDPLLGLASTGNISTSQYSDLESRVNAYLMAAQKNAGLYSASVSFHDFGQSDGFSINPDEQYDPASLTKIPLMMAYYYLAETDPSILSDQIYYSGSPDLDASEQIESKTQLAAGTHYTVEEMIDHMILYSDNNAEQLLADHLAATNNLDVLDELYDDLGITIDTQESDDTTVQTYTLIFRVLYNATYLDRADSEKALRLLSETDFMDGIRASIPSSVPIAEKFGDARMVDAAGKQVGAELQNCGIVYYPGHAYLLCIMTKGDDVADLEQAIAGVSNIIYQDMVARYPEQLPRKSL